MEVNINSIYALVLDSVVSSKLEDELFIIPVLAEIGKVDDNFFILNESGSIIWELLDGQRRLQDVVDELSQEFDSPAEEIAEDVICLVEELLRKRLVVEVSRG